MGLLKRMLTQALPDPIAEEARRNFKIAYTEGRCRAVFGEGTDSFRSCLRSRPLERQAEKASQRWIRALVPGTLPEQPPEVEVTRVRRKRTVAVTPQFLYQMAERDGDLMGMFDSLRQEDSPRLGSGLIRRQIIKDFNVDESTGIIRRPGKFEGEQLFIPYFHDRWLEGFNDGEIEHLGNPVAQFMVNEEERQEFPELEGVKIVNIMEREDGFVVLFSTN